MDGARALDGRRLPSSGETARSEPAGDRNHPPPGVATHDLRVLIRSRRVTSLEKAAESVNTSALPSYPDRLLRAPLGD